MGLKDLTEFTEGGGDDGGSGGDEETTGGNGVNDESTQLATTRLTLSGMFEDVTEEEAKEMIVEFGNEYIEEFNSEMDDFHMSNLHTEASVRDVDESYAPNWYSEDE